MMHALLWPLILFAATPELPEPSAVPDRPYRVLICLRADDNPLLTPSYMAAVRRQVADLLTNLLGPLAEVQVRTEGHWLLDDYPNQEVDRPELTPELLARRQLREKCFLARLDHRDDLYQVTWRQADGSTGYVGPIRTRQTPDRAWVAKAICLAVRDDFGAVAEVRPPNGLGPVSLLLRGQEHLELQRKVVGPFAVFQPYWVLRLRNGQTERRQIPNTLLKYDFKASPKTAEVVTNQANPWERRASVAGFEAIKVNTRSGRLRLQILDSKTGEPVRQCNVAASDKGFEMSGQDILGLPDIEGFVFPKREFPHLAYVLVSHGGRDVKVPVPITAEVCEHVIRLQVDKGAADKNDVQRKLRFLIHDTQTMLAIHADFVRDFNELNKSKRYEDALKRVTSTLEDLAGLHKNATDQLRLLRQQAELLKMTRNPVLEHCDKQLKESEKRRFDLSEIKDSLVKVIEKRDSQARADVIIKLAMQLEQQGDIQEAIDRYDLALSVQEDQPGLAQKVAALKETWQPKNQSPEHKAAQQFVFERWSNAEITTVQPLLPQAERALETLKSVNDYLTARKLSSATGLLLTDAQAVAEQAAERGEDADKKEADKYIALTETLANFLEKVETFVETAKKQPAGAANVPPSTPANKPRPGLPPDDEEEPIKK